MSLAEPQRSQRDQGLVGFAQKKNNRCSSNALHLISLSEIIFKNTLRVLRDSSGAGGEHFKWLIVDLEPFIHRRGAESAEIFFGFFCDLWASSAAGGKDYHHWLRR
jgi:hypothetical protein